ncbi:MAG: hypothetical protein M1343_06975 [Chloroflexi bacterium]|nr:hypothetical protein [Chloroflexota bacterium]MDA8186836.1 hypothetical protein [Dehalococcoidales bacterium]
MEHNLLKLSALDELNDRGCTYGHENRQKIEAQDKRIDAANMQRISDIEEVRKQLATIDGRLWAILVGVALQLAGIVGYVVTHPGPVRAFLGG